MTKKEIDQKVKELAEVDAKIQASYVVNPDDLKSQTIWGESYMDIGM